MKHYIYFRILTFRIILFFILAMVWSSISDYIQENTNFYGDTLLEYRHLKGTWRWGWRHWLTCFLSVILTILYIVRIINWSEWFWEDNKNEIPDLKSSENNYITYAITQNISLILKKINVNSKK